MEEVTLARRRGWPKDVALALQRAAGNRAVAQVLARSPSGPAPSYPTGYTTDDPAGSGSYLPGQPGFSIDPPAGDRLPGQPDFSIDDPEAGQPEQLEALEVELEQPVITPGGQAAGEPRSLAELWVGDLVTWKARYTASAAPVADISADPRVWEVGNDHRQGEVTFTLTPTLAADGEVWMYMAVGPARWNQRVTVRAVIDLLDFGFACSQTLASLRARYGAAGASAAKAARGYQKGYNLFAAALERVQRSEEATRDLLFGGMLAVVGGAAGGAVGGLAGAYFAEIATSKVVQGALTDAGKDLAKFAVRATQKLGSPSPGMNGGVFKVEDDDPFTFLTWWAAELDAEESRLAEVIEKTIAATRRARNEGQIKVIDEDPTTIVDRDAVLTEIAEGMPEVETAYLAQLWCRWLATYSHKLVEEATTHPGGGETHLTIESPLYRVRHEVIAAAEVCGESYQAWITQFALPLRERLRIEGRREAEERGIRFQDPFANAPR